MNRETNMYISTKTHHVRDTLLEHDDDGLVVYVSFLKLCRQNWFLHFVNLNAIVEKKLPEVCKVFLQEHHSFRILEGQVCVFSLHGCPTFSSH